MPKLKNNNKGFTVVELLLVIVTLAIIGVVGYLVANHVDKKPVAANNTNSSSTNTTSNKATGSGSNTTTSTNPYAGWKNYTSTVAGYSIKYPTNWTLRRSTNNGGAEDVLIDSPNYFEIQILSFSKSSDYWQQSGSSESCGFSCQSVNKSTRVSISGYGELYIDATTGGAGGGTINNLMLFPSVNNTLIASPTISGIYSTFNGVFQGLTEQQQTSMTPSQFLAKSDIKTAELIYKSLSY